VAEAPKAGSLLSCPGRASVHGQIAVAGAGLGRLYPRVPLYEAGDRKVLPLALIAYPISPDEVYP
jgi:hypothetical protein